MNSPFTGAAQGRAMSYGVNLSYISRDNIIFDGPALRKNINSGEIENWGVETNLGYRINRHWRMNANYSWLHMENPVLAAPEHKLYAVRTLRKDVGAYLPGIQYVVSIPQSPRVRRSRKASYSGTCVPTTVCAVCRRVVQG